MTDGDKALAKVGKEFKEHHYVRHSMKEFAFDDIHVNRAEGYAGQLRRSVLGVYHYLSQEHLQKYLYEMAFRWGHRQLYRVTTKKTGKKVKILAISRFNVHLGDLMQAAIGRRLHYTKGSGLRHWDEPFDPYASDDDDQPKPRSTAQNRAIMRAGREGEF
jgi:hypothetical protein